jgi:hypothetical protein
MCPKRPFYAVSDTGIDAHSSIVYDWFSPGGECILIWANTLEVWLDDWLTRVEKAHTSVWR